jgi:hypothetical protein
VRQHLGTENAEMGMREAQVKNTNHQLRSDLEQLTVDLEEEKGKRMKLADEKNRMEHRMLEQIQELKEQRRADEATRQGMLAHEEALQRKVRFEGSAVSRCFPLRV